MKSEMKKMNEKEVKGAFWLYIISFSIMIFFVFIVLFFFNRSYKFQDAKIQQDIIAYNMLLNKQQVLKQKIDTVYNYMSLLNTGMVNDDRVLVHYISKNIQEIREVIGRDSSSDFKHYSMLIDNVGKILKIKDTMITITNKEQLALRDLNKCTGDIIKVKKDLSVDPTRGFSTQ